MVAQAKSSSSFRAQCAAAGVTVIEHAGLASFVDAHTVRTEHGQRVAADRFIICTGGRSRKLPVPGIEFTATHSDAWSLTEVPQSLMVIGAGATGAQVASIFNSFGSRVQLFHAGERIVPTEDHDVSAAVASGFRANGVEVHEDFGEITGFEKTAHGVQMNYSKDGRSMQATAAVVVLAIGWEAAAETLDLAAAGVERNQRGFVQVDEYMRCSAPHIFAAGDVTGRMMLVPQAITDGFIAATNAVQGPSMPLQEQVSPIGSFTDPEYAQVGRTEAEARKVHDVLVEILRFDATTRTIIDGRTFGFCKLIVDRSTRRILGCHVVGERAVEIAQSAAIAMAGDMPVDVLARIPLSFPTYAGIIGRVAAQAARKLNLRDRLLEV